jgi:2-oxoglutarate ferredoxin oxidoreductase subunit beta
VRADRTLVLEHGKPMIFGKERNKGLRLAGERFEIVTVGEGGVSEDDIFVHDETREDPTIAFLISRMDWPEYPVPVGVFRAVQRPTYDALMQQQIEMAQEAEGAADLRELFLEGDTWTVE